jgi:translation elongation factor EF-G
MLCGTAFKNKGVQRMLDAVIEYLAVPVDICRLPVRTTTRRKLFARLDMQKFSALAQADDRPLRAS